MTDVFLLPYLLFMLLRIVLLLYVYDCTSYCLCKRCVWSNKSGMSNLENKISQISWCQQHDFSMIIMCVIIGVVYKVQITLPGKEHMFYHNINQNVKYQNCLVGITQICYLKLMRWISTNDYINLAGRICTLHSLDQVLTHACDTTVLVSFFDCTKPHSLILVCGHKWYRAHI